jgi:hypothetical protein
MGINPGVAMTSFKKLALFFVAAGSVLSAQAQTGSSDVDRRMRNREEIVARHQQMESAGTTTVPALTAVRWHRHHGHVVHHRPLRMHRHHVG